MAADSSRDAFIEFLLNTPVGSQIRRSMDVINRVIQNLYALAFHEDPAELKLVRIGSVFQLFLVDSFARMANGNGFRDLTAEDWKDIAGKVSEFAILPDGKAYSEFVFSMYADYIDLSAKVISTYSEKKKVEEIQRLAHRIRERAIALDNGDISEVDYSVDCLWLSLEAMVKLLSATAASAIRAVAGPEYAQFVDALAQVAFEYGRYVLYAKEQAILKEYVQNQRILDERLRCEYDAFFEELRQETEKFQSLVDQAFSADIQERLHRSSLLAEESGVQEEGILRSLSDVDAFFLD